jgi:hypothetical protein
MRDEHSAIRSSKRQDSVIVKSGKLGSMGRHEIDGRFSPFQALNDG